MNKKFILVVMIFTLFISSIAFSNSAEPPSLIIVVPSGADQVEIAVLHEGQDLPRDQVKVKKYFEIYHQFYLYDFSKKDSITLEVNTSAEVFTIKIEEPFDTYRNIYTLDLDNRRLNKGYNRPFLNFLLILLRVGLTLIIEGIVFYILGFRWKQSWRIFLLINLLTQGALNIWLSTFNLSTGYSTFLALVFAEIIILIVEGITFFMGINEKNKIILLLHIILANGLSFIAGGYLITLLPL